MQGTTLCDEIKENLITNVTELSSICRGCLATERRMIKTSYEDIFKNLTGIIISPSDGLPQWMCYECSALLHKYNRFRSKVLKSHKKLCQYLVEGIPFTLDKVATPHLSQTPILYCDIAGTQNDKLKTPIDDAIKSESEVPSSIIKMEKIEIKEEPIFAREDNIAAEQCRQGNYETPIESASIGIISAGSLQCNLQIKQEASSQEPHVGTEAAQQQLHKHVGDSASTLHNDDAEGEKSVDSSSSSILQSYLSSATKKYLYGENLLKAQIRREKTLKCDVCLICFPDESTLTKHARVHTALKLYECDVCKTGYRFKRGLIKHFRDNTCEKPYKCEVCMKCFNRKGILDIHMRVHADDKSYTCDVCMKSFSDQDKLIQHALIHGGDKTFKCDVCTKSFKYKSHFSRHLRIHTGDQPYKCEVCMKCFSDKGNLTRHMPKHTGQQPFKCNVCNKCFSDKGNLTKHIRVHTGDKPYKCDVCMKCFSIKEYLNRHKLIHTVDKPYECDVCIKQFTNKRALIKHIRIHTGDKRHKCNVCLKSFSIKEYLNRHKRIHTGDKRYECDVCGRCFSRRGNLNKHVRLHTGEKSYKCDVCWQTFADKSSLTSHSLNLKHYSPQPPQYILVPCQPLPFNVFKTP